VLDLKRSCRRPSGRKRGQEGPGRQRSRPGRAEQEARPWKASPAGPKVKPPGGGVFFCAGLEAELPPTKWEEEGPGGPRQAAEPAWKGRAGGEALEGKSSRAQSEAAGRRRFFLCWT